MPEAPSKSDQRGHPKTIVLFVPGSMQAFYDQSTDTLARQMASALDAAGPPREIRVLGVEKIRLGGGRTYETCRLQDDACGDVLFATANCQPIVSGDLERSGPLLRAALLILLWFRCFPLLVRVLSAQTRPGHTGLERSGKNFVILSYALVILAAASAVFAALSLTSVITHRWPMLALLLIGLQSPAGWSAILKSGQEYHGVIGYLLVGKRRDAIQRYLGAVRTHLGRAHPGVPQHIVAFSFGSIVCFDYLFPRRGIEPAGDGDISSVSLIGFPYVMVDSAIPGYFSGRDGRNLLSFQLQNYYLENDYLGSSIQSHLPEMFTEPLPRGGGFREVRATAQQLIGPSLSPFAPHFGYWDPGNPEGSDTIRAIVRSVGCNAENNRSTVRR